MTRVGEQGPGAASEVLVRLLGDVVVTVGDQSVDLGPRRQRELLAALAVEPGVLVALPSLAARVWGEDASVSPTSVHALVSRLRAALRAGGAGDLLVTQPPGYRLDAGRCRVDAAELGRLVAEARRTLAGGDPAGARDLVDAALGLWRGQPLADVRGDHAAREAARLEELRLTAVELGAELDLALGRHDALLDHLGALVRAHPLREPLRAAHVVALYRADRQAEALASWEEGRAALAEELGVDPGPALRALHQRVLGQDPGLAWEPAAPVPATSPAPAGDPAPAGRPAPTRPDPWVGRAAELAHVVAAARAGLDGGGPAVVVVTGEAGIGKTRLVRAAVEQLAAASGRAEEDLDVLVARGQASEHPGAPALWPWEQVLGDVAAAIGPAAVSAALASGGPRTAPVARLLPGAVPDDAVGAPVAGGAGGAGGADGGVRLADAVVAFLEVVAAQRPVLVVLEDLHWSDADTLAVLGWWTSAARSGALALLATVRDPADDPRTVDDALAALTRGSAAVVALAGLGAEEVGELVAARLGAAVAPEVAGSLHRRTDGNPFYLGELVRLLSQERSLAGRADVPVPSGVRAVVERRLRHLAEPDRDLLAAAAVLGRTFDPVDVAALVARPLAACADALDRAAAVGVLDPAGSGAADGEDPCRFVHALVQEVLVAALGPMRRAALHASAAEVLERRHTRDLDRVAAALAHHFGAAGAVGDPERSVRYALRAASVAEGRLAYAEAERLLRRALDQAPGLATSVAAELELDACVRLGSLLSQQLGYNHPDVVALRQRAADLASAGADPGPGLEGSGRAPRGDDEAHLTSALWGVWGGALVSGDVLAADRLSGDLGVAARRTGSPRLALAHAQSVGQVRWHQGRLAEAEEALREAVARADADPELRADLYVQHPAAAARGWLAVVHAQRGEPAASDEVAAQALRLTARLDHPFTQVYVDILEGWRSVWLERPAAAVAHADRAVHAAAEHGFAQLEQFALPPRGWGRGRLGDPAAGADDLETALATFGALPSGYMFGPLMHGALGEVRLDAGDPRAALDEARTAVAQAQRAGDVGHLAEHHRLEARALLALGERLAAVEAARRALTVAAAQGAALFAERAAGLLAALGDPTTPGPRR